MKLPTKSGGLRVVLGTPDMVSDPRISCLLSASMRLWQADLLFEVREDISQFLLEPSPYLSRNTQLCVCVSVCRGESQV